jgi:hypothetical protein
MPCGSTGLVNGMFYNAHPCLGIASFLCNKQSAVVCGMSVTVYRLTVLQARQSGNTLALLLLRSTCALNRGSHTSGRVVNPCPGTHSGSSGSCCRSRKAADFFGWALEANSAGPFSHSRSTPGSCKSPLTIDRLQMLSSWSHTGLAPFVIFNS